MSATRMGRAAWPALAAASLIAAAAPALAGVASMDQVSSAGSAAAAAVSQVGWLQAAAVSHGAASAGSTLDQAWPSDVALTVQDGGLDGNGLYAEVHQSAPDARSDIFQTGAMNSAVVYQTLSAGAVSSIVQSGFGNTAVVSQ